MLVPHPHARCQSLISINADLLIHHCSNRDLNRLPHYEGWHLISPSRLVDTVALVLQIHRTPIHQAARLPRPQHQATPLHTHSLSILLQQSHPLPRISRGGTRQQIFDRMVGITVKVLHYHPHLQTHSRQLLNGPVLQQEAVEITKPSEMRLQITSLDVARHRIREHHHRMILLLQLLEPARNLRGKYLVLDSLVMVEFSEALWSRILLAGLRQGGVLWLAIFMAC